MAKSFKEQLKVDADVFLNTSEFACLLTYTFKASGVVIQVPGRVQVGEASANTDGWQQNMKDTAMAYVKVEDVPSPAYGDTITDEDGVVWTVERILSKKVFNIWGLAIRKNARAQFK